VSSRSSSGVAPKSSTERAFGGGSGSGGNCAHAERATPGTDVANDCGSARAPGAARIAAAARPASSRDRTKRDPAPARGARFTARERTER
jgi:hypothetical protein